MNLNITFSKTYIKGREGRVCVCGKSGNIKNRHAGARFPPPYEHQYSMGYIDIYICKTYINEGGGRWGSGMEVRGKKKIDMLVLYPRPPMNISTR